jgi:hypothetical protein
MVGHPQLDGGTFLPPHGRVQTTPTTNQRHGRGVYYQSNMGSSEWASKAMRRYKKTGCSGKHSLSSIWRGMSDG